MFGGRISLLNYSKRIINLHHTRFLCNKPTLIDNNALQNPQNNRVNGGENDPKIDDQRHLEAYRDLDNLDFMKASKILFSDPPSKKKKFGFDFHLVQLFFALMPSLAVYLVAQYSRYEMRKMEADLERKKQAEEEKKAKELLAAAANEIEPEPDSELSKVKERLEALEEVIKEIAVVSKKQSSDDKHKSSDQSQESVDPNSKPEVKHESDKNQASNQASTQSLKQEDIDKKGSGENEK